VKKVLFLLVAMVCILAATAATWAYAQDSGHASGGVNGSVEEITPPKPAANPPAPSCKPNVVGGREIAYDQQGNFAGYGTPKMSTANQDKDWRKFASRQGWLTRREASALDAQILRKSKAYADLKDREVLKAAKGYTDRKIGEVNQSVNELNGTVNELEKETVSLHNSMNGYKDKKGHHPGVIETLDEHTEKLYGKDGLIEQAKNFKGGLAPLRIAILAFAVALLVFLFLYMGISRRLRDLESDFCEESPETTALPPDEDAQRPTAPAAAAAAPEQSASSLLAGEEDVLAAEVDPTRI